MHLNLHKDPETYLGLSYSLQELLITRVPLWIEQSTLISDNIKSFNYQHWSFEPKSFIHSDKMAETEGEAAPDGVKAGQERRRQLPLHLPAYEITLPKSLLAFTIPLGTVDRAQGNILSTDTYQLLSYSDQVEPATSRDQLDNCSKSAVS